MAHFIEFANDDATTYKGFDEAEWRQIMKFVRENKYY